MKNIYQEACETCGATPQEITEKENFLFVHGDNGECTFSTEGYPRPSVEEEAELPEGYEEEEEKKGFLLLITENDREVLEKLKKQARKNGMKFHYYIMSILRDAVK